MASDRLPWHNEPRIDPQAATEKAIAAAQVRRADPNTPGVTSWARKALQDETERLKAAPDGTRNHTLFTASRNLFEIVAAGALDETSVLAAMHEGVAHNGYEKSDGARAAEATISSARRLGLDNPRDLTGIGQRTNGFHLHDEPVRNITLGTVLDLERGFWTQRDSLQTVYLGALARMCSPWAVLAHCVARALALVRPNATLPPIIGSKGSLNWFGAIAASSGGGKGGAAGVARELVSDTVLQRNLGSGEGLIDAYVKPANKETGEPSGRHESVMFVADEIDNMHALGTRVGSTMPAILRSGFSGETIGFSYRTSSSMHLETGTYRMTLIVSVQPARAGALMDDTHGGTLQRFMWFPGTDPRITAEIPPMPGELMLPSPARWQYPRELKVPYDAIEMIRDERARSMRGEQDCLDGHALYIREKFAYGLAVIDGRDEMTDDDWRLAGIASRVSDHTRSFVAAQLDCAAKDEATRRGALQGVSSAAADEEKTHMASQRLNRIAKWVLARIEASPPISEGNGKAAHHYGVSQRELTQAVASRDRPYLPTALEMLNRSGVIEQNGDKRWSKT